MISEIMGNEEVKLLGIEIFGLSILNISPNKETSKALEAQAREQILKMADEAIYERQNASIEQERKDLIDISVENAKAYELTTVMKSLDSINPTVIKALATMGMKPDKLIAMAFQELAVNANKIIIIKRKTRLEELIVRYNTVSEKKGHLVI